MSAPTTRYWASFPRWRFLIRPVLLLLWLLLGLLVSAMLLSAFASVKTVFQVIAESEYAYGHLDISPAYETTHLEWLLYDAVIRARSDDGNLLPTDPVSVRLSLSGPAVLEAERIATGSLRLALRKAPEASGEFSVIIDPGQGRNPARLMPPVFIEITDPAGLSRDGKAISLPFQAINLSIGREPNMRAAGVQPILRSGEVTVFGRTFVERRLYIAKSTMLRGGDVVTAADPANTFKVFLRVDERPAIQTVSRVEAEKMAISGFFTDIRYENLTIFDMLANDRILTGIWSLIGLAIAVIGVYVSGTSTRAHGAQAETATEVPTPEPPVNPLDQTTARAHTANRSGVSETKGFGEAETLKPPTKPGTPVETNEV